MRSPREVHAGKWRCAARFGAAAGGEAFIDVVDHAQDRSRGVRNQPTGNGSDPQCHDGRYDARLAGFRVVTLALWVESDLSLDGRTRGELRRQPRRDVI